VSAIAEGTFLLAPSLSRILKDLEARDLLSRSAVATDQRRAEISLTTEGRSLVASVAPQSEAVYNQIETAYGDAELKDLMQRLATFRLKTSHIMNEATR
jgi:DNA-binding MarR family transcriptional regulator